jgi:hypothetical protein
MEHGYLTSVEDDSNEAGDIYSTSSRNRISYSETA